MRGKLVLFTVSGITLGFIAGFIVANSINRSEISNLKNDRAVGNSSSSSSPLPSSNETLSSEEIRAKIKEADDNPENLKYQKNLGLALYQYGAMQRDVDVISEAARLLDRAAKLAPDDVDITVGSGNAWFDIGYIKKDNKALEAARALYDKALATRPNDADIRTDLGMTYFLETPPNDQKAIAAFKRSLAIDPKNEKALEFIIQSCARLGDSEDADKYLAMLKAANPTNTSIAALSNQIASPVSATK